MNGEPLSRCARCASTLYCGRDCQSMHWKKGGHKIFCIPRSGRLSVESVESGTSTVECLDVTTSCSATSSLSNQCSATSSNDAPVDCLKVEKSYNTLASTASAAPEVSDDYDDCPICLELVAPVESCKLPCKHSFHVDCVAALRRYGVSKACPMCRSGLPTPSEDIFENATRRFVLLEQKQQKNKEQNWAKLSVNQLEEMSECLRLWTCAADQGNAKAYFNIGVAHFRGYGVPRSSTHAAHFYLQAAERGSAKAQTALAYLMLSGDGVPKSFSNAAKWLKKAAAQGSMYAQYSLGILYDNGRGISQSHQEAAKLFRKAAEQGHAEAQFNIGAMVYAGSGVAKVNRSEALQWFKKAAAQGQKDALSNVRVMHVKEV